MNGRRALSQGLSAGVITWRFSLHDMPVFVVAVGHRRRIYEE